MTNEQATNIIRTGTLAQAKKTVREMLHTNDAWLVRGMVALFNRQTSDEQAAEHTKHHNKVGFNGLDSTILTSFAKQWLAKNWLSSKQMNIMRRKMTKYSGQLALIAREGAAVPA